MFSEESPYLTFLERKSVSILKIIKGLIAVSVVVFIAAVLTKMWWLLAGIVPIGAAVLYFSKLMQSTLIEQRAIILAVEALATDFVGWGQLFPIARSRAEAMFARDAGDWPKLIELYLPRERRTDAEFIRMFTPSGSMSAGTTVTHPILEHPMGLFGKLFSKRADPELERARQHLEQLIQDSKKPMGADEEAVLAYREALIPASAFRSTGR